MGLREVKAGTTSSDAECVEVSSVALIAGVTISILIALIMLLLAYIIYRKRKALGTNECKNLILSIKFQYFFFKHIINISSANTFILYCIYIVGVLYIQHQLKIHNQ